MIRPSIRALSLGCLLLFVAWVSLCLGASDLSMGTVANALWPGIASDRPTEEQITIVWQLRVPRMLLGILVGLGLGVAGAAYQGLFRNPLVDPYLIGASGGAALGATLAIVLGWSTSAWGLAAVSIAAWNGSLLAVGAVVALAYSQRPLSIVRLLLIGVAMSGMCHGIASLLMMVSDDRLVRILAWLLGSLSTASIHQVLTVLVPVVSGSFLLWMMARPLDAIGLGDDAAQGLGVSVDLLRWWVIVVATLVTASCVAVSGTIGFVGLIAPHIARRVVGTGHALLLPASGLCGAILVLVADDVARRARPPWELPIGVLMAIVGSPFFLLLLRGRDASGTGHSP
jgi:iron complex transport system permease protein